MSKTILFIGHNASLTGAPNSLLRILKWLDQNSNFHLILLIRSGGPLLKEFKKIIDTYVINEEIEKNRKKIRNRILASKIFKNRIIKKIIKTKNIQEITYRKILSGKKINLVFSNTVTNGSVLQQLTFLNCPVICRIAEMRFSLSHLFHKEFCLTQQFANHYITVAEAVKRNLVNDFNIPGNNISIVYGAMDIPKKINKLNLRKELNLANNAFIVGGSGTNLYRKGADIFINTAFYCKKKLQLDIHFVWLGGERNTYFEQLVSDAKHMGINDFVHFIDNSDDPLSFYNNFDVFFMSSRYDPFPLSMVENAYLKKPIICFNNSGGAQELINSENGFVVPYGDIIEASKKIELILENKELLKKLGANASTTIKKNFLIQNSAQKILNTFKSFID